MKFLLCTVLFAYVCADVSHLTNNREADAKIIRHDLDVGVDGQYQWSYETDNGIAARAQGALKNPQDENPAQVAQGEAKWTAPGGEVIQFSYIADENGYQPQGSHLPTPPPIPEEIARALEFIRANPPKPEHA